MIGSQNWSSTLSLSIFSSIFHSSFSFFSYQNKRFLFCENSFLSLSLSLSPIIVLHVLFWVLSPKIAHDLLLTHPKSLASSPIQSAPLCFFSWGLPLHRQQAIQTHRSYFIFIFLFVSILISGFCSFISNSEPHVVEKQDGKYFTLLLGIDLYTT